MSWIAPSFAILSLLGAPAALAGPFDVILSEIHYNPAGGDPTAALEYVELHNLGTSDVDLSLWRFTEGISYEFPSGAAIHAGEHLVLSPDPDLARTHWGVARALGPYTGRLDNGGEVLELVDSTGSVINRVHYRDDGPWPARPDGLGPSLEYTGLDGMNDLEYLWAPSRLLGGTPGAANSRTAASPPGPDPYTGGVLNEIRPREGATSGFIEIYNPTLQPLSLGGFFLLLAGGGESFRIPAGTTVDPGAFRVFQDGTLGFNVPSRVDVLLLLEDDGRTIVDALELRAPGSGNSLGRFPDGGDDVFAMTSPSMGAPNVYTLVTSVVIHEIQFHPPFVPPGGGCSERCSDSRQWIELWNRSGSEVDISGWSLTKGVDFTFPTGTKIEAAKGLVVAASPDVFRNEHPGVTNVVGGWTGRLSHSSDTINLRDDLGNRVDHVEYSDGGPLNDVESPFGVDDRTFRGSPWPSGADGTGRTIELVNPGLSLRNALAWRVSTLAGGTPGSENSTFTATPGPIVDSIRHEPLVPRPGDAVKVTCEIGSLRGIASAQVEWAPDGGVASNLLLRDDGIAPDEVEGDGKYGAFLPGQGDGTVVRFRILVTDRDGVSLDLPLKPDVKPYAEFRGPYYLYEVDGTDPPANGSPVYRIIMTARDRQELQNRSVESDVLLPATFIGDGKVRHVAGIRFRGETSRHEDNRSFRVEFASEASFDGVTRLNLNGSNGGGIDASNVVEVLANDLFRRAGMPYAQTFPVNLRFAGEVPPHFDPRYVRKENLDDEFLSRYFGGSDRGNLYRGMNPGGPGDDNGDLTYLGESPAPYRPLYEKRSNREEDDYTDLIELTRVFDPALTPANVFADEIEKAIDVEEWARFFALEALLGNEDGGIWNNNGEDYFLYHVPADSLRPDRGKFLIVPWDLNESFADDNEILFRPELPTIRRFLTHPRFAPLYYKHLSVLSDGVMSRLAVRAYLGFVSRMYSGADATSAAGAMETFVRARLGFVDEKVPTALLAGVVSGQVTGTPVISPGDLWRFFRGRSQPPGGLLAWTTRSYDSTSWEEGPTGIGYADGDDATVLSDMEGQYTTVFARRTFPVSDPATIVLLTLIMDYDDAFVAYVNGVEIARSAGAPGKTGDAVSFDAVSTVSHEAGTAVTFEFTPPPGLLVAGSNVLAVVALNNRIDSTDLSMIPTLLVSTSEQGAGVSGGCGGVVYARGAEVTLGGQVDPALTRSVTVAGFLAELTFVTRGSGDFGARWKATVPIQPGENRIRVEAHDDALGAGRVVQSTEVLVRRVPGGFQSVGGVLPPNALWTAAGGPYRLTSTVEVAQGEMLRIEPGAAIAVNDGVGIDVRGVILAEGTEDSPIVFESFSCDRPWLGISLLDTGTQQGAPTHVFRHCVFQFSGGVSGGGVIASRGSKVLLDGCVIRVVRSVAVAAANSVLEIQDSLVETALGGVRSSASTLVLGDTTFRDIVGIRRPVDFDGDGPERSVVRSVNVEGGLEAGLVFRRATVDILSSRIQGVADSAVQLTGAGMLGTCTFRDNLVHDCGTGLALRDGVDVEGDHNTITACRRGLGLYATDAGQDGGHGIFHSVIVWQNGVDVDKSQASTVSFAYSLLGSVWPGAGNVAANPRFRGAAVGDFNLQAGSPAVGAGMDGTDMGALPYSGGVAFLRGDTNQNGDVDISDAIATLNFLFGGGPGPRCADVMDVNDDGKADITDAVYTLLFLFLGGTPIAPPYPEAGPDPTPDDLPCEA